jgi:hypothetical protein
MATGFHGGMTCETGVSVFRAIVEGVPEGACIEIGYGTILIGIAIFAAEVMMLQWIVRRLVARVRGEGGRAPQAGPVWRGPSGGGPIR